MARRAKKRKEVPLGERGSVGLCGGWERVHSHNRPFINMWTADSLLKEELLSWLLKRLSSVLFMKTELFRRTMTHCRLLSTVEPRLTFYCCSHYLLKSFSVSTIANLTEQLRALILSFFIIICSIRSVQNLDTTRTSTCLFKSLSSILIYFFRGNKRLSKDSYFSACTCSKWLFWTQRWLFYTFSSYHPELCFCPPGKLSAIFTCCLLCFGLYQLLPRDALKLLNALLSPQTSCKQCLCACSVLSR